MRPANLPQFYIGKRLQLLTGCGVIGCDGEGNRGGGEAGAAM